LRRQRLSAHQDALDYLSDFLSVEIEVVDRSSSSGRSFFRVSDANRKRSSEVREAEIEAEWYDARGDAGFGRGVYFILLWMGWDSGSAPMARPDVRTGPNVPAWVLTLPESSQAVYQWGTCGVTLNPWRSWRLAFEDAQAKLTRAITLEITDLLKLDQYGGTKFIRGQREIVSKAVLENTEVVSVWPDLQGRAGLGKQVFVLVRMPVDNLPETPRVGPTPVEESTLDEVPAWIDRPPRVEGELYASGSSPIGGTLRAKTGLERARNDAVATLARTIETKVEEISLQNNVNRNQSRVLAEQASSLVLEGARVVAYWPDLEDRRGRRYFVLVKAPDPAGHARRR
jgi:hypothetical protein